jgi:hypothetical protein
MVSELESAEVSLAPLEWGFQPLVSPAAYGGEDLRAGQAARAVPGQNIRRRFSSFSFIFSFIFFFVFVILVLCLLFCHAIVESGCVGNPRAGSHGQGCEARGNARCGSCPLDTSVSLSR